MGTLDPLGRETKILAFFQIYRGEFVSAKRCHQRENRAPSRRWTRQHWSLRWRRFRGRTTTTTTTTATRTTPTTKTTTRGGSEAVRNAGRRPDRSQAAGVVRRADAESPKEAAVPRVAAPRARVAKAGVARNVAAAKAAVPSRRRASGRIHERPAASKLIPAPVAAKKSIASKLTRSKRTPGVFPRARKNADSMARRLRRLRARLLIR